MAIRLERNYIFAEPGGKAFLVSSNYVNYFELGAKGVTDYYIEAKIKDGEHIVSGTLYSKDGNLLCTLKDNQVEDISHQCEVQLVGRAGYRVVHNQFGPLLELVLKNGSVCVLKGRFYDSKGGLVAEGDGENFLIFKGPAVLGKSGNSLGIVIGG